MGENAPWLGVADLWTVPMPMLVPAEPAVTTIDGVSLAFSHPAFGTPKAQGAGFVLAVGHPARVVWANEATGRLFGTRHVGDLTERLFGGQGPGPRRLRALAADGAASATPRLERLRFVRGFSTEIMTGLWVRVPGPDGAMLFGLVVLQSPPALPAGADPATAWRHPLTAISASPAAVTDGPSELSLTADAEMGPEAAAVEERHSETIGIVAAAPGDPAPQGETPAEEAAAERAEAATARAEAEAAAARAEAAAERVETWRRAALAAFDGAETVRFRWRSDAADLLTQWEEQPFATIAAPMPPPGSGLLESVAAFDSAAAARLRLALETRSSWSGIACAWPLEGGAATVPVVLGASPRFETGRRFAGFGGFGLIHVARLAAAEPAAESTPLDPARRGMDDRRSAEQAEMVASASSFATPSTDRREAESIGAAAAMPPSESMAPDAAPPAPPALAESTTRVEIAVPDAPSHSEKPANEAILDDVAAQHVAPVHSAEAALAPTNEAPGIVPDDPTGQVPSVYVEQDHLEPARGEPEHGEAAEIAAPDGVEIGKAEPLDGDAPRDRAVGVLHPFILAETAYPQFALSSVSANVLPFRSAQAPRQIASTLDASIEARLRPFEHPQAFSSTRLPTEVPAVAGESKLGYGRRANGNLSPSEQSAFEEIARTLAPPQDVEPQARGSHFPESNGAEPCSASSAPAPATEEPSVATPDRFDDMQQAVAPDLAAAVPVAALPQDHPQAGPLPRETAAEVAGAEVAAETSSVPSAAMPSESALLDHLPLPVLLCRNNTPRFANRALLDLLGEADPAAFLASDHPLFACIGDAGTPQGEGPTPRSLLVAAPDGTQLGLTAEGRRVASGAEDLVLWTVSRAAGGRLGQRQSETEAEQDYASAAALPRETSTIRSVDPTKGGDAAAFAALADSASDALLLLDAVGHVVAMNQSARSRFVSSPAGSEAAHVVAMLATESQAAAAALLRAAVALATGERPVPAGSCEVLARDRDGVVFPARLTLGRLDSDGLFAELRDLSELKRAERDRLRAERDAERATGRQPEFLSKVSYEIRTPLNAILGFAEVMMDERFGPLGNARYKDYLKDIHSSGTQVMNLINDLLDLSRIEAGRLDLELDAVDINKIIVDCVATMQPQAHRERVIMRTSLGPRLPLALADPRTVRQIVLNLLSNAVKFNEPGGQVIVSSTINDSGGVAVRIRDTGIGMSDSDIAAALEPFRQLASTKGGGTGLGLPLTKALIGANGASLSIRSRPKEGTLVEVVFSVAPVRAAVPALVPA